MLSFPTVGIFLPAFLLVAVSGPLVPRIRKSKPAGAFLDGVNVCVTRVDGCCHLGTWARQSIVDTLTVLLAVASSIALLRFRVNSARLILAGAIVGSDSGGCSPTIKVSVLLFNPSES